MFCCTLLYVHSSIAIIYLIIYLYSQFAGNVFVSMIEKCSNVCRYNRFAFHDTTIARSVVSRQKYRALNSACLPPVYHQLAINSEIAWLFYEHNQLDEN